MGTNRRYKPNETELHVRMNVSRVILHPKYRHCSDRNKEQEDSVYDVCLLKTKQPFLVNKVIQTIKIPDIEQGLEACSEKATYIGVGRITFNKTYSDYVLYADTSIQLNTILKTKYTINSTQFVSKGLPTKSVLYGDSGGPLVCYHGPIPVLYGIIASFLHDKKNKSMILYNTYESVENHIGFIRHYIPEIQATQLWMKNKAIANLITTRLYYHIFFLSIITVTFI